VPLKTLISKTGFEYIMLKIRKILLVIWLIMLSCGTGMAQIGSQQNDTVKVKKVQTSDDTKAQKIKESDNHSGENNNNAGSQSVKQVKSARPDMSKSRGARPPDIVRPSGSRIPKGMGKPAGAVRPGHG
jgi:hypothetical protein